MSKKKKIILTAGIGAAVVCAGLLYFLLSGNRSSSGTAVYVTKVSDLMGISSGVNRFSGVVQSQQSVDLQLDSGKTVSEIYVTEGQQVRKGDKLFSYDVTEASNSLASAQLDIEGYNETISQLNTQISELQAERNQTGSNELLTEIQAKQLEIKENQINIQKTQNSIQQYQSQIDNNTVLASIDGVVKSIHENGTDAYGNAVAFMSIAQTGEFRVKGKLDEQSIGSIVAGQQVLVRSRTEESKIWKGTVSTVESDPETDNSSMMYGNSSDSSSQYPFYVSLESTDGLMLGQHVYVEPDYGQSTHTEGVWLDTSYLVYDEDGKTYVWTSVKDHLRKVAVEIGEQDENTMQVEILSGIDEDSYIAWPQDTFQEGQVTVQMS